MTRSSEDMYADMISQDRPKKADEQAMFDRYMRESPLPERSFGATLKDVGVTAAKTVVGAGETAVGLANLLSGGAAGEALEKYTGYDPAYTHEVLGRGYSETQQEANRRVEEAKGFVGKLKAYAKYPSVAAHQVGESIAPMFGGGAIAKGLLKAAPKMAPYIAGAIGEGAVGAGATAEQIRQQKEGDYVAGDSIKAMGSGIGTAFLGAVGGRLAQKFGFADVDTMMASWNKATGGKKKAKDVVKNIIGGGVSEGVFEEMPQSAQEAVWMNAALDRPLLEGVPEQAAGGLVTGGMMGGGANIAATGLGALPAPKPETVKSPDGPLTKATKAQKPFTAEERYEAYQPEAPPDTGILARGALAKAKETKDKNLEMDKLMSELYPEEFKVTEKLTKKYPHLQKDFSRQLFDIDYINSLRETVSETEWNEFSEKALTRLQEMNKPDEPGITEEDWIAAKTSALHILQQKAKPKPETKPKEKVSKKHIAPTLVGAFEMMKTQVSEGETKQAIIQEDGTTKPTPSTYPDWFKQKQKGKFEGKWSEKEFNILMRKAEAGKTFTEKQQARWNELERVAQHLADTDPGLAEVQDIVELEKKGFEPVGQEMFVGNLKTGDKVVIKENGTTDEYEHKGYDKDGNAIMEDGDTKKLDPFETLDVQAIKKTKKEEKAWEPKKPEKIDEEAYLAREGASKFDLGEAALHKNIPEGKIRKKLTDRQLAKDRALSEKREKLREKYKEKVEAGEFKPLTREERLIRTAQGHPDNEATQAARKLLDKKGISYAEKIPSVKREVPAKGVRGVEGERVSGEDIRKPGEKPVKGGEVVETQKIAKTINDEINTLPAKIKNYIEEIKIYGSYLRNPSKANDVDIHIRIDKNQLDTPQKVSETYDYLKNWIDAKKFKKMYGKSLDLNVESDEVGMGVEKGKGLSIYGKPVKGGEVVAVPESTVVKAEKLHKASYGLKPKNSLERLLHAKQILDEVGYSKDKELYTENERLIANYKKRLGIETVAEPSKKAAPVVEEKPEISKSKFAKAAEVKLENRPELATMQVDTKAIREKTGEVVTVKENAKVALEQCDDDIFTLQKLLDCL